MRGKFVLVLGTAVVAAVAVTQWKTGGAQPAPDRDGDPAQSAPGDDDPLHAKDGSKDDVSGDKARTPDKAEAPIPLVARVDERLAAGEFRAAAAALLTAEGRLVGRADVRDRLLRTADALTESATRAAGTDATAMRLDARKLYAAVYDCEKAGAAEQDRAYEGCRLLHKSLLFGNGASDELVLRHVLKSGDRVWSLSRGAWRAAGVTAAPGFVLYVNGISDPRKVPARGTLRVPREPISLLIRKSRYELTVRLGGVPVERFRVGVGASESTPAGVFQVKTRLKNPDWYFRGRKIPYGDPENVIGTRWLGLEGGAEADGIGIHGTNDATSVGKAVSMGCIRMRDDDVERVFEWVETGTEVEIRD